MKKYNTFWPRLGAIILDGIIISVAHWLLSLLLTPLWPLSSEPDEVYVIVGVIWQLVPYAYYVYMTGRYGQTLGKMALDIKVVDNETEGKIDFMQAFKREALVPICLIVLSYITNKILFTRNDPTEFFDHSLLDQLLALIPSMAGLLWAILEIITMLFDDKNRALHDKIADTVVVKV